MRLLLSIILTALLAVVSFAQGYQLVEPTGVITADVYFRGGRMIVNDANGTQYLFFRDHSFDSLDRQYAGYFLPGVNRVVRFPRSGMGLMQVADLDDVFPRYVFSRRSVRRRGGPGGRPHRPGFAFVPPYFLNPYGFPLYGYGYQSFGTGLSVGPTFGPAFGPTFGPIVSPPWYGGPIFRSPLQSIVLDSSVIPRAPLPPVTLNLLNSAARTVIVTVNDRAAPGQPKQLRIAPRTSEPLTVQRDTGADRVRRVRTYAPDGSQVTREIRTPIDPLPRYELVVHEWRLQSVAIDRTGKSPNRIEDSQFQGRGLGRFQLPPGDQLTPGTLDVVKTALQAENQGSVAPMLDETDSGQPLRPLSDLERMLLEQRKAQGR